MVHFLAGVEQWALGQGWGSFGSARMKAVPVSDPQRWWPGAREFRSPNPGASADVQALCLMAPA